MISACQREIDVSAPGVMTSPNYPDDYLDDLNCVYVFYAPVGYRVSLTFTLFDLEDCRDCACDKLEVRVIGIV